MTVRTETGVGGYFCASHRDRATGRRHGHTWDVVAWFVAGDAEVRKEELAAILTTLDHSELPDELAWGESIAAHILTQLTDCTQVSVSRPSERIFARATRIA